MFFFRKNIILSILLTFSSQISPLPVTTPGIKVRIPWPDETGALNSLVTAWVHLNLEFNTEKNAKTYNLLFSNEDIDLNIKTDGQTLGLIEQEDNFFFKENIIFSRPTSFKLFDELVFGNQNEIILLTDQNIFLIIRRLILFAAISTIINTFFKFSTVDNTFLYLKLQNYDLLKNLTLVSSLKGNYIQTLLDLIKFIEHSINVEHENLSLISSRLRNSSTASFDERPTTSASNSIEQQYTAERISSSSCGESTCNLFTQSEDRLMLPIPKTETLDEKDIAVEMLNLNGKAIVKNKS